MAIAESHWHSYSIFRSKVRAQTKIDLLEIAEDSDENTSIKSVDLNSDVE